MQISFATRAHQESLVDLLCELHAHYNDGPPVERAVVREHAALNLLAEAAPHRLAVATDEAGRVLGLAAIALVFSIVEPSEDLRRHCQLKELYVRAGDRGRGVGRALMEWVAGHAWDQGCRRIDWPVKASNSRGIAFYEGLGAERVADRVSYRLSGDAIHRLTRGRSSP